MTTLPPASRALFTAALRWEPHLHTRDTIPGMAERLGDEPAILWNDLADPVARVHLARSNVGDLANERTITRATLLRAALYLAHGGDLFDELADHYATMNTPTDTDAGWFTADEAIDHANVWRELAIPTYRNAAFAAHRIAVTEWLRTNGGL